jgi:hypothetical protein
MVLLPRGGGRFRVVDSLGGADFGCWGRGQAVGVDGGCRVTELEDEVELGAYMASGQVGAVWQLLL